MEEQRRQKWEEREKEGEKRTFAWGPFPFSHSPVVKERDVCMEPWPFPHSPVVIIVMEVGWDM